MGMAEIIDGAESVRWLFHKCVWISVEWLVKIQLKTPYNAPRGRKRKW